MQLPPSLSRLAAVADDVRSGRWIRSLPWLVSVALVLLLAWQVVQLGWTIMGAQRGQTPGSTATAPATSDEPPVDLRTILGAHLFGVAGAAGGTDPNSVAATQMSLVLVGTIAESDPERGYAIIGESATNAKVYAVGKTITGGTKLHAVYPDRAILDRGGRLEALMLPRKFQGGGAGGDATAGALPRGNPMLGNQLHDLATGNPAAITDILRPQPVFANGQQRGFRVYPGRNRQQFTKLGLMPGDLVTAVNGAPLDDPARGMEVLESMNSAADVTVTVERNGQPTQITINNAQVAADAAAAATLPEAVPVTEVPATPGRQDQAE
jgi:general secretion pathway protein C